MNTLKKIVALGDSITKGVIYDGESYKILPTGFVSQCADNFQADIDNYGRMGCTVTRGTQIAEQHAEAIAGSDVTLVEFGGNDSDFCWTDIASAPADAHYPMTELPTFRSIYRNLIERIRKLGSKPVLMTLPLIDDKRFYNLPLLRRHTPLAGGTQPDCRERDSTTVQDTAAAVVLNVEC